MTRATANVGVRQRRRAKSVKRRKHSDMRPVVTDFTGAPAALIVAQRSAVPAVVAAGTDAQNIVVPAPVAAVVVTQNIVVPTPVALIVPLRNVVRARVPRLTAAQRNAERIADLNFDRNVGRARRYVRNKLASINARRAGGDLRAARQIEDRLLASPQLKLASAAEARKKLAKLDRRKAIKKNTFRAGRVYGPTSAQARRVAGTLDLESRSVELVGVIAVPKGKGGFRPLRMFELEHRTRQKMFEAVLSNRAPIDERQYALIKGLKAAQRDIVAALRTGRYHYAVTADIKAFFSAIDVNALPELLGLSAQVVESNLNIDNFNHNRIQAANAGRKIQDYEDIETDEHIQYIYSPYDGGTRLYGIRHLRRLLYQTTPGIAQGSSCSPVIAEYVIADLLSRLPTIRFIVTWADDILILAETREEVDIAVQALSDALRATRGGPFHADVKITPVASGFKFIGSNFRADDGAVTIAPTPDNRKDFDHKMRLHLHHISHRGDDPAMARKSLNGWLNANLLWPDVERHRQHYEDQIFRARQQFIHSYQGQTRERVRNLDEHFRVVKQAFLRPRRRHNKKKLMSEYYGS